MDSYLQFHNIFKKATFRLHLHLVEQNFVKNLEKIYLFLKFGPQNR